MIVAINNVTHRPIVLKNAKDNIKYWFFF
jgi:hypothetical protein